MSRLLRFDDVEIDLQSFRLLKAGEPLQVEPKSLKVLIFLAESQGRLVERQELIDAVWSEAFVTDHVLNRAIGRLRKALQDDPKQPRYIETVPTLGYRFIAEVERPEQTTTASALPQAERPPASLHTEQQGKAEPSTDTRTRVSVKSAPLRFALIVAFACLLLIVVIGAFRMSRNHTAAAGPIRSLAVLPLKNLSGDASQDYLADGMTEEIITDLEAVNDFNSHL